MSHLPPRSDRTDTLLPYRTLVRAFSGRGNDGIGRMTGGCASRVLVELVPARTWGARFRRGLAVAAVARPKILADGDYFTGAGPALLWLEPWDEIGRAHV